LRKLGSFLFDAIRCLGPFQVRRNRQDERARTYAQSPARKASTASVTSPGVKASLLRLHCTTM